MRGFIMLSGSISDVVTLVPQLCGLAKSLSDDIEAALANEGVAEEELRRLSFRCRTITSGVVLALPLVTALVAEFEDGVAEVTVDADALFVLLLSVTELGDPRLPTDSAPPAKSELQLLSPRLTAALERLGRLQEVCGAVSG